MTVVILGNLVTELALTNMGLSSMEQFEHGGHKGYYKYAESAAVMRDTSQREFIDAPSRHRSLRGKRGPAHQPTLTTYDRIAQAIIPDIHKPLLG